jgi:hypothetical protein
MIKRFRAVIPGKLYRGSAPSPRDVLDLKDKLGIKKIISLDKESGDRIHRTCQMLGIEQVKMYLDHTRQSLYNFLSQDMKKLFLEGGPVFFHCHEGKDRTGLAAAIIECKFLGKSHEKAIEYAKSLGFGWGLPPESTQLYEKVIRHCKPSKDDNSADIVSLEREYKGDNRDSFLDEAQRSSFAPYLDHTRQNPMDAVYTYITDQSPTRQNYPDTSLFRYDPEKGDVLPNVGEFDNDAGQRGFGPSENYNGFFSEVGK